MLYVIFKDGAKLVEYTEYRFLPIHFLINVIICIYIIIIIIIICDIYIASYSAR